MTRRLHATILTLAVAALTIAATVTASQPAGASPPQWGNGHDGKDRYEHGYRKRKHRYRERKQRRYRWTRRHRPVRRDDSAPRRIYRGGITGGHLIGGLLGAATGTQFGKGSGRVVAVLGGAILGAVLGGEFQKSIRRADRRQAQSTLETAPTGRPVSWKNPDTRARYTVTPTRTYRAGSGRFCRDYTTWVFIGGYEEKAYGTACRMPDGSWKTTVK